MSVYLFSVVSCFFLRKLLRLNLFVFVLFLFKHFQVKGFPPVVTDCSSSGAGQLVTKPINLKIMKGEQQELKAQFVMPVS